MLAADGAFVGFVAEIDFGTDVGADVDETVLECFAVVLLGDHWLAADLAHCDGWDELHLISFK